MNHSQRTTSEIEKAIENINNTTDGTSELDRGYLARLNEELGKEENDGEDFMSQTSQYIEGYKLAEEWLQQRQ